MQIIAHRGYAADYPQNTLEAIQAAERLGAEAIEFDIHLTRDAHIVICHDPWVTLQETRYAIAELSLEQVQRIVLDKGCRIPTLNAVVESVSRELPLVLDIKQRGMIKCLQPFFQDRYFCKRVHVTSFIHAEILELRQRFEMIPCSVSMTAVALDPVRICHAARVEELSLARDYLDEPTVAELHRMGLRVRTYTINDIQDAQRVKSWGVNAIYTDALPQLKALGAD